MITKILVALDYQSDTPKIFEQAVEMADKFQASLEIFHCVEPLIANVPEVSAMAAYGGLVNPTSITHQEQQFRAKMTEVSAWLEALSTKALESNISNVSTTSDVGEPKVKICQAAAEHEVDLIIIGRRGLNALSEVLIGSVSSYVMHHAPCSVMVVQH